MQCSMKPQIIIVIAQLGKINSKTYQMCSTIVLEILSLVQDERGWDRLNLINNINFTFPTKPRVLDPS